MKHYSPQWWKRAKDEHRSLDTKLVSSLITRKIPSLKQLKYLPKLLSPREYLVVKILVAVIAVNVAFLGWQGYTSAMVVVPKEGGTYIEGFVGTVQYVNPILLQYNDVDRDLVRLVYSGLLKYDVDRKIVPDIAERFEMSSDQRTYTFYLRKDVVWHDGTPLNADDVLFTIGKIQDPRIKSSLYLSYKDVYVRKVDDATVQFGLPKAFAPFLDLATVPLLPRHIWKDVDRDSFHLASYNVKPVGSGAWKFKSFKKDRDGTIRSYSFIRNDGFYGEKPFISALTIKFYPDSDSAIQALKNRNVQGISFLPRELRDKLTKDTGLQYYTFSLPQYTAVFFNQSLNADLKSKAVRQALAFAVDTERIVRDVLAGEGSMVHAPILPGFLGFHKDAKRYPYDQARATSLLETAGWKKNAQGVLEKSGDKKGASVRQLNIVLTTVDSPEHARAAEIIRENWRAIGVQAEVQLVDPGEMKTAVIDARNYQALLYGEIIGSDPDLYPFWHSSQARAPGLNLSVYSNSEADTLLEQARGQSESAMRSEKYRKFQDILLDEVPAIFLYSPAYNYVVARTVKGIQDKKHIIYPSDRFVDSAKWYIKTQRVWKK